MNNKIIVAVLCLFLPIFAIFTACDNAPIKYKLQFVVDDAIYYIIDTAGSEVISLPNNPTKENYEFEGWYWDYNVWHDAFTVNSLLNHPLTSDMKVYAKWRTVEDVVGVEANFTNFQKVDESTYSTKVNNDVSTMNFSSVVEVNSNSTWTLNTDIYAQNPIPSKIATLEIGDNTYYVLVTAKSGDVKLYSLNIRRLPMYDVTYSNSLGATYKTIQVQEEKFVNSIELDEIRGYTFETWQYDFTQPIMSNTNIVAKFSANQYKIIYHSNFGDDEIVEQDVLYDETITFKANNMFTRNGYSLIKWNTDLKIDEMAVSFSPNARYKYDLIENLDVYAEWRAINYSIRYYLYDSVNNYICYVDNSKNVYNYTIETDTFELVAPTSNGFTFIGWFTDNAYENKIETIETGSTGYLTFYAKWDIATYNITYYLDDGINSDENPLNYTYFDDTIMLKNASKNGYDFVGWYRDITFENSIPEITSGSYGDIVIYAKWQAINYTITYLIGNSVKNPNNPTTYNIETETIILQEPTYVGYDFVGWFEVLYSKKVEKIEKGSIGNIGLYAEWKIHNYNINYHLNGGQNNLNNPNTYTTTSNTFTLQSPTRDGYTFEGWYTNENFTNKITKIYKGSLQDFELYAKWEVKIYSITYYLDDGINNENNVDKYSIESDDINLYDATKTGYSFDGWYSENTFINKVDVISKGNYCDISLFAKFTPINYTITYYLDGGENNGNNPNSYNVESATITLQNPTKVGYDFIGWYSDKDFINKISKISKGSHQDIELYAKLEISIYQISYYLDDGVNKNTKTEYTMFENEDIILNNPTKVGYNFIGWYSDNTYANKIEKICVGSYGDINLFAKWELINQGLQFRLNNNSTYSISGYKGNDKIIILPEIYCGKIVNTITRAAFDEIYFYSLYITKHITQIYDRSLYHIINLREIIIDSENPVYDSRNNCNAIIETATNTLIRGCNNTTIPDGISSLGDAAFAYCYGLTSINIPSSISKIGKYTFLDCLSLVEVYNLSQLTFNIGYMSDYGSGVNLKVVHTSVEEPSRIIEENNIAFYVFDNEKIALTVIDKSCEEIIIAKNCTEIYQYAFQNCINLTELILTDTIYKINMRAYSNCSKLEKIYISSSVNYIGIYIFEGCSNLESIIVDENNKNYDSRNNCNAIIERKTNQLVYGCKSTIIPNNIISIASNGAWYGCYELKEIELPNSVTKIGHKAFEDCKNLECIYMYNSIVNIDGMVFYNCPNLKIINYFGKKSEWNAISKYSSWYGGTTSEFIVHCTDGDIQY